MDDIRPTIEQTEAAVRAGWTQEEAARGYAIVDYDGTGLLHIEAIGEMCVFDSDEAACLQAARDGVKIIPVSQLPKNFEWRYFGWLDTKENRDAIIAHTKRYCTPQHQRPRHRKRHKGGRSR